MCKFQQALDALLLVCAKSSGFVTTEQDLLRGNDVKEINAFICGYLVANSNYNLNDNVTGFLENKIKGI